MLPGANRKEEIYDSNKFAELQKGEFILSAGESNVSRIKHGLKSFHWMKTVTDSEVNN